MNTLGFTAVTSSGRAYDFDFPLHPQTRSPEGVSDLLTALLESVSRTVEGRGDISDGDVFQALAITLAIRARMVNADPKGAQALMEELFSSACGATWQAEPYPAGRA